MKSESLADQKMETPKGRDTLIKRQTPKLRFLGSGHLLIKRLRHPNQKAETSKLRFLKLVSLADEKEETTPW